MLEISKFCEFDLSNCFNQPEWFLMSWFGSVDPNDEICFYHFRIFSLFLTLCVPSIYTVNWCNLWNDELKQVTESKFFFFSL